MAKNVETIVTMTDDLDGAKADRTISFAVEGANYEIDLSRKNANAFQKLLAPYVGAARKVKPAPGRRTGGTPAPRRGDVAAIRQWAQKNGFEVSGRGRIAARVVDAYNAAH